MNIGKTRNSAGVYVVLYAFKLPQKAHVVF